MLLPATNQTRPMTDPELQLEYWGQQQDRRCGNWPREPSCTGPRSTSTVIDSTCIVRFKPLNWSQFRNFLSSSPTRPTFAVLGASCGERLCAGEGVAAQVGLISSPELLRVSCRTRARFRSRFIDDRGKCAEKFRARRGRQLLVGVLRLRLCFRVRIGLRLGFGLGPPATRIRQPVSLSG